eukprot:365410-Chlamydomonas_euryale.AAC.3
MGRPTTTVSVCAAFMHPTPRPTLGGRAQVRPRGCSPQARPRLQPALVITSSSSANSPSWSQSSAARPLCPCHPHSPHLVIVCKLALMSSAARPLCPCQPHSPHLVIVCKLALMVPVVCSPPPLPLPPTQSTPRHRLQTRPHGPSPPPALAFPAAGRSQLRAAATEHPYKGRSQRKAAAATGSMNCDALQFVAGEEEDGLPWVVEKYPTLKSIVDANRNRVEAILVMQQRNAPENPPTLMWWDDDVIPFVIFPNTCEGHTFSPQVD